MTCATQRKKEPHYILGGKVLTTSAKAVKIDAIVWAGWIPKSVIADPDRDEVDQMEEGDDVEVEVPQWWARREGLI